VSETQYERRAFLAIVAAGSGGYLLWARQPNAGPVQPTRVRIADFDASGRLTGIVERDAIRKTNSEWMKQLPPDSYSVTRQKDTEFAGTGGYEKFYEDGIYRCICCGTAGRVSRNRLQKRMWLRLRLHSSASGKPR
jgi:hypothetical protein